jgi:hypothetical protein
VKFRTLILIAALTLFVALAVPLQLAAQHRRYKLVDVGTSEAPENTEGSLAGLWRSVISSPSNSFPSFKGIEQYGEGTWTGSGQPDLTPPVTSNALGTWERVSRRKFHVIGQFWTYDTSANSTGFAAVHVTITVSKDGNTYHGDGTITFFDNDGNSLGSFPFVANAKRIAFPQVADSD